MAAMRKAVHESGSAREKLHGVGGIGCSIALILGLGATSAHAQDAGALARERARVEAERQAAERAARAAAPDARLDGQEAYPLGDFPEEEPCFAIQRIEIEGGVPEGLGWVEGHLGQFRGKCMGAKGLDHVLRSLQGAFLERGLITTRAGAPEQDLASGVLKLRIVPGKVSGVRVTPGYELGWAAASPVDPGALVSLRALEQGLEQMRRIPARAVEVQLEPGTEPGESVLAVTVGKARPISGSLSLNNFASGSVGRWQGAAQLAALDVLGLSEIVSASYNRRIDAPGVPADSQGTGLSASIPWGWWTFGVSGSASRYGQTILGEVRNFETRGRLYTVSGYGERVIHRDRTSKTSLRATLSRRWARSYIDDVEIGLQRQDLSDIELALIDRRQLGRLRLDSELAVRFGVDLFGAQDDAPGQPAAFPTARYRIVTADIAATLPMGDGFIESWRLAFRGQVSGEPLYGSDLFSAGGPYTVRGYDSDRAVLGKTGWYLRQELTARIGDHVRPYLLLDMGRVENGGSLLAGLGGGVRAAVHGFTLDAFAAIPLSHDTLADNRLAQLGLSIGWGF
ncbi:ShlB/FhaC/HecB family hemolysin secretion/activation protein [Sphingomonas cavernae]|uniref:ShlB/FhaC/HecB family hemolysin secretion/activation protein n=1 Tax=Sphingomonas cavernae TaxID=2320861 RepID=A0A418WJR1_9SPHN|nr:ShlB/FhaC/HecB family hemolysin secretion/activation protein [Sphingomonas cavernae]RJF90281.1 ShlB/FhaC/HecB family hemolysin secretion/activation protein [Sphingomonas cavernae]